MFKIETHLHTKEVSPCGWVPAADQIAAYHAAGYSTVFVADHFSEEIMGNTGVPWNTRVDHFLSGYRSAKEAGDRLGVTVLLSAEYKLTEHPNHYLIYGLTEEFLRAHPESYQLDLKSLHNLTRQHGMLLIQAHPFRGGCEPRPLDVDGLEVRNTNPRHFVAEDEPRAVALAEQYGLFITGGSDAHRPEDAALCGVGSPYSVASSDEFIALLRSGKSVVL